MACNFDHTLFLGASVSGFQINAGLNQQQTSLTVTLAEDPLGASEERPKIEYRCGYYSESLDPDYFYLKDEPSGGIGTPAFFKFGELEFGGLIQNWEYSDSPDGQIYNVVVTDPRELLSGVVVITGGYSGETGGIPNLLNAYAHMEGTGRPCEHTDSGGYGGAEVNEGGMPWNKIKQGIEELAAPGVLSDFGGPIAFKGHLYYLDISELPEIDDNFRISGNVHTVLDLIDFVCSSMNCDYLIELIFDSPTGNCSSTDKYIKVQVIPRGVAPALGKISQWIADKTAEGVNVASSSSGFELRVEPTTGFLVGGEQEAMFPVIFSDNDVEDEPIDSETEPHKYNIWPYWGEDYQGKLIMGRKKDDEHTINVDITSLPLNLESILTGGERLLYPLDVLEMRHLLVSEDAWLLYLEHFKPTILTALAASSVMSLTKFGSGKFGFDVGKWPVLTPADLMKLEKVVLARGNAKKQLPSDDDTDETLYKYSMLYSFLLDVVEKHYGKKFMVSLQEICSYKEVDSDLIIHNVEPVNSGWAEYDDDIAGADHTDLLRFREDDGKLHAFVKYVIDHDIQLDPLKRNEFFLNVENAIVYKNGDDQTIIYVPCEVDPKIRFVYPENVGTENPAYPKVIITVDGKVTETGGLSDNFLAAVTMAITKVEADRMDDIDIVFKRHPSHNTVMQKAMKVADRILKKGNLGELEIGIEYQTALPHTVVLPLKSKVLTYGPWISTAGPTGPVNFEQNPDLVPWNYGSQDNLDEVGAALVAGGLSAAQVLESGTVTFAGIPDVNIGRALLAGGPIVTSITVGVGVSGLTTTYTMRTYTNKFGVLAKANADRLRRISSKNTRLLRDFNNKLRDMGQQGKVRGVGKGADFSNTELMRGIERRRLGVSSKSPITMLYASTDSYVTKESGGKWLANEDDTTNIYSRHNVALSSYGEFISTLTGDDWKRKAYISLDGIFTPYTLDANLPGQATGAVVNLPSVWHNSYEGGSEFVLASKPVVPPYAPNNSVLDKHIAGEDMEPTTSFGGSTSWKTADNNFTQNNIAIMTAGATEPPADLSNRFAGAPQLRSVALRGPLMLCGWGFDTNNRPVPNMSEDIYGQGKTEKFAAGFMEKPHTWKCGPVDLRWDAYRGVWTSFPGFQWLRVTLDAAVDENSTGSDATPLLSGNFAGNVQYDAAGNLIDSGDRKIFVNNIFGYKIAEGEEAICVFDYSMNEYIILMTPLKPVQVAKSGGGTRTVYVQNYRD